MTENKPARSLPSPRGVPDDVGKPAPAPRTVYSWPSRSRCPGCKSIDTVRQWDRGPVQGRVCRGCDARYKVVGEKV